MDKCIQSLLIAVVLATAVSAPKASAAAISTCSETAVKAPVVTRQAIFLVDCDLLLSSPININGNTIIDGNGFAVTFDGQHSVSVIDVPVGASLTLENSTQLLTAQAW